MQSDLMNIHNFSTIEFSQVHADLVILQNAIKSRDPMQSDPVMYSKQSGLGILNNQI